MKVILTTSDEEDSTDHAGDEDAEEDSAYDSSASSLLRQLTLARKSDNKTKHRYQRT
jgi:hypothetical protein